MGVKTRNGRLHTELHTLGVLGAKQVRVFTGRENRLADGVKGVHSGLLNQFGNVLEPQID